MKRPATPDQTVPSRRPRLHPPDAQPAAAVEDYPTPPTAVEDVPVVHPSVEQPRGSTDSPDSHTHSDTNSNSYLSRDVIKLEDTSVSPWQRLPLGTQGQSS